MTFLDRLKERIRWEVTGPFYTRGEKLKIGGVTLAMSHYTTNRLNKKNLETITWAFYYMETIYENISKSIKTVTDAMRRMEKGEVLQNSDGGSTVLANAFIEAGVGTAGVATAISKGEEAIRIIDTVDSAEITKNTEESKTAHEQLTALRGRIHFQLQRILDNKKLFDERNALFKKLLDKK